MYIYTMGILSYLFFMEVLCTVNGECHFKTSKPLSARGGKIPTGSVRERYNDNQYCKWTFEPRQDWSFMKINLQPYDIKSNNRSCYEDVLNIGGYKICQNSEIVTCIIINKGENSAGNCGVGECKTFTSHSWPPTIVFKSDQSETGKWFSLEYSFKSCNSTVRPRVNLVPGKDKTTGNDKKKSGVPMNKRIRPTTTEKGISQTTMEATSQTDESEKFPTNQIYVYVILGSIILILVVVISIIIFCHISRERKRQKPKYAGSSTNDGDVTFIATEHHVSNSVNVYETIRDNSDIPPEYGVMKNNILYADRLPNKN